METIEILKNSSSAISRWSPSQGEEIEGLIRHKGFIDDLGRINEAGENVIDETFRIMEMCGDPNAAVYTNTGLILGYVQSGKTLSFTSLTALANDNGYQIIILIAGTSLLLSNQSYKRMEKDLRIETRNDRKWTIIKNASSKYDLENIEKKLEQWKDQSFPRNKCTTVLITVMKHASHLSNLTKVLKEVNLVNVPTLIIDDEGDQASLNTKANANKDDGRLINEGDVSVIYNKIDKLRMVFSNHTFLQYTATPQANLFINIMSRLSPNFIKVLKPGKGYVGGASFFLENPKLIRLVPSNEINNGIETLSEPPSSLLLALKVFYLGVSAGELDNSKDKQTNRSMMVHPSRLTGSHKIYYTWIKSIQKSWERLLGGKDEIDKSMLLDDFLIAYQDLKDTVGTQLPDFKELVGNRLVHAVRNTCIIELNSSNQATPIVNWNNFYSHILVGGQAMDRGFTVEGLTVTYMPRSLATAQVDTTLQRARFFGYKGTYLGYCRIWLDQPTIAAYISIVEHEEDVRKRLLEFDINNRHLNELERGTVLDEMLRLTRPNIISDSLIRTYFGKEWFIVRAPHDTDTLIIENKICIEKFLLDHSSQFNEDSGHINRTSQQIHLNAQIPLQLCLFNLLNRIKFSRASDSQDFSSIRSLISNYLTKNSDALCSIYIFSSHKNGNKISQNIRKRRLNNKNEILTLHQGSNPKSGLTVYPGDAKIKIENQVSVQIHRLHILGKNGENIIDENNSIQYQEVYSVAVWLPQNAGKDLIIQPENKL